MFIPADFKAVVLRSGLTKAELAQVYGVSRQTVYSWLGDAKPALGGHIDRMALAITRALLTAIKNQVLPMPAVDRGERRRRVLKMTASLHNLRPGSIVI